MTRYQIEEEGLYSTDVLALLEHHLNEVHSWAESCKLNALPPERLRRPDMTFFTARDGKTLAAIGALKELSQDKGELKSMRASPAFRGKGAGEAILVHLITKAKSRGYVWLGLETGKPAEFAPARRLYSKHGFVNCPPFGEYRTQDFGQCMELLL